MLLFSQLLQAVVVGGVVVAAVVAVVFVAVVVAAVVVKCNSLRMLSRHVQLALRTSCRCYYSCCCSSCRRCYRGLCQCVVSECSPQH